MAKEKENSAAEAETKEVSSNVPTVIETETGVHVDTATLLNQIQDAEVGLELGSDYLTFAEGQVERVVFIEITEMPGMGAQKGTMVEAVKLLSASDGRFKINGDRVLVSTCKTLSLKGRKNVPLQVVHKGIAISKSGFKYKDLQINELLLK